MSYIYERDEQEWMDVVNRLCKRPPPKPVVWVRNEQPHLPNSLACFVKVYKNGDAMQPYTSHHMHEWHLYYQELADVRVWEPPKPKPEPRPYETVRDKLNELYEWAQRGSMTGYDASLAKWDALIEWCEETGKVPQRGSGLTFNHGYWNVGCGLCAQYKGNCAKCPLDECNFNPLFKILLDHDTPSGWLTAAKAFRAYIVEKCEPPKPEPKPVHRKIDGYGYWTIEHDGHHCLCKENGELFLSETGNPIWMKVD